MDLSGFTGNDARIKGGTLKDLETAERELPDLLRDTALGWNSLLIDYHPPVVERLWIPWNLGRIMLHRIHPCAAKEALIHPHPWPSSVRLLSGSYMHLVGTKGVSPLDHATILMAGSCYSITSPDIWHSVSPAGDKAFSLMVSGKPWDQPEAIKADKPLEKLDYKATGEILMAFRQFYPVKT